MYPPGHRYEFREPFKIENISDQTIEGVSKQNSLEAFVNYFGKFSQI
jgi:hypothetical protein